MPPGPDHNTHPEKTAVWRKEKGYLYPGSQEGFMVVEDAASLADLDERMCRVKLF